MRADELLTSSNGCDGVSEGGAAAVAQGVVGQDPFDAGDAVAGEVGRGPGEEPGAGGALLVGEDLAVGQAGVVIDQGVHVVVADPATSDLLAAPECAPPAAVGDASDLLDVDVDGGIRWSV